MEIISKTEFSKAANLSKFRMPFLSTVLMELMKINDFNDLIEKANGLVGVEFADKVLEILGVTIELDQQELRNIPAKGAFIAIANHPYGGIEALILLKILCTIRPETKFMANFLLEKIPNIKSHLIPVNPFHKLKSRGSTLGLKNVLHFLKNEIPIGIFPAGEVSSFNLASKQITDIKWHPVVGKIIAKADVPVLPIYFSGNNGLLFNLLSLIHPTLKTAKLPSELFNKKGHTIKVRIGKPIKNLIYKNNSTKLLSFLRAKTYALGAGLENENRIFKPNNFFKINIKPKAISMAIDNKKLETDISLIQNDKIYSEKNYEVYISPTSNIPNIIKEIGRLREITFREVGEGTNNQTDLDKFDIYYYHLFIWDTDTKMVVGAYRIGKGDEIFYSLGKRGFYIAELFKIKKEMNPILKKSLELGRSWIRKEYQLKPLPLFLLWKGILKYLTKYPNYQYLIGPVSISNSYSKFSKSLIVNYITKNNYDNNLSQFVKPRKKFKVDFSKIDNELLLESNETIKGLDNLISELETTHLKVPVMLRQYLGLNAKIICFNIDPKFSNSLDGFLVADLKNMPQEMLDKLGIDNNNG